MKPSTKRFVSMVVSLVMVAAAAVVYFDFIRPAYTALDRIRGEAAVREEVVRAEAAAVGEVKKLISTYRDAGELQDAVSTALPFSPDPAAVLAQLQGIADVNRLLLQSFSPGSPTLQNASDMGAEPAAPSLVKPFGTLTFQIRFVASYEDFKAFVGDLETNLRVFDVKSLTFQPAGKPNEDFYAFDMIFSAYYQTK